MRSLAFFFNSFYSYFFFNNFSQTTNIKFSFESIKSINFFLSKEDINWFLYSFLNKSNTSNRFDNNENKKIIENLFTNKFKNEI